MISETSKAIQQLRNAKRLLAASAIAVLMTGCSVLNPYETKSSCPDFPLGKCTSVPQAYKESLSANPPAQVMSGSSAKPACPDCIKNAAPPAAPAAASHDQLAGGMPADEGQPELSYQSALYRKYTKLLKEPVSPILVPAQVLRVLLLPYEGDGKELFTSRYAYIRIKDSTWIFGEQNVPGE